MDIYDLRHIAGYCSELGIWTILNDVLTQIDTPIAVSAESVHIVDDTISVDKSTESCEEAQCVWTVGAMFNFLSSGRMPFGGRDICYHRRNPDAKLPVLRPEHSQLQELVHLCLKSAVCDGLSLTRLRLAAADGLEDCRRRAATSARIVAGDTATTATDDIYKLWPEEM